MAIIGSIHVKDLNYDGNGKVNSFVYGRRQQQQWWGYDNSSPSIYVPVN